LHVLALTALALSPFYLGSPVGWPNAQVYYEISAQVLPVILLALILQTSSQRRYVQQFARTLSIFLPYGERIVQLLEGKGKPSDLFLARSDAVAAMFEEVMANEKQLSAAGRKLVLLFRGFIFNVMMTKLVIIVAAFSEMGALAVLFTGNQSPIVAVMLAASVILAGGLLVHEMTQVEFSESDLHPDEIKIYERLLKLIEAGVELSEREKGSSRFELDEEHEEDHEDEGDEEDEDESRPLG
jgi:hypothetical protein